MRFHRANVCVLGLCGVLLSPIRASDVCASEIRLQEACLSSDLGDSTSVNRAWCIVLLALRRRVCGALLDMLALPCMLGPCSVRCA